MSLLSHVLKLTFSSQAPTMVHTEGGGVGGNSDLESKDSRSHPNHITPSWGGCIFGLAKQMGATSRLNPLAQRGKKCPSDAFRLCDVCHPSARDWRGAESEKTAVMKFLQTSDNIKIKACWNKSIQLVLVVRNHLLMGAQITDAPSPAGEAPRDAAGAHHAQLRDAT